MHKCKVKYLKSITRKLKKKKSSYKVHQWSVYHRLYLVDGRPNRFAQTYARLWCEHTHAEEHCNGEDKHSLSDSSTFKQTDANKYKITSTDLQSSLDWVSRHGQDDPWQTAALSDALTNPCVGGHFYTNSQDKDLPLVFPRCVSGRKIKTQWMSMIQIVLSWKTEISAGTLCSKYRLWSGATHVLNSRFLGCF